MSTQIVVSKKYDKIYSELSPIIRLIFLYYSCASIILPILLNFIILTSYKKSIYLQTLMTIIIVIIFLSINVFIVLHVRRKNNSRSFHNVIIRIPILLIFFFEYITPIIVYFLGNIYTGFQHLFFADINAYYGCIVFILILVAGILISVLSYFIYISKGNEYDEILNDPNIDQIIEENV